MLLPAKTKYRKVQKGRIYGNAKRGSALAFGDFGIQVMERGKITAAQLEAARVAINRHLKRKGKMWMRVFPQKPITKKPAETRMGKGKGNVEYWVAVAKPGAILFELAGISLAIAREAMSLADRKLGLRCRFLSRETLVQRF
ncbi:MAG: 50S ribosomal protein L16 [Puniceicoccales bacterium]|nr:50S ribosomal protein L16 [Puniceicoccales bacterium]